PAGPGRRRTERGAGGARAPARAELAARGVIARRASRHAIAAEAVGGRARPAGRRGRRPRFLKDPPEFVARRAPRQGLLYYKCLINMPELVVKYHLLRACVLLDPYSAVGRSAPLR